MIEQNRTLCPVHDLRGFGEIEQARKKLRLSAFDGRIVGNVEFEDVQLMRFAFRQCAQLSCGLRIPALDSAHRGKDMVFLACKRFHNRAR
jgi:hypothetical protein